MHMPSTLDALLDYWADRQPDKVLFRFHQEDNTALEMTSAQLRDHAQSFARALLQQLKPKAHVLLTLSDSREFIIAFFACMYAGVVAIPAPAIKGNQKQQRLRTMLEISQPSLILCDASQVEKFNVILADLTVCDAPVSDCESIRAFADQSFESLGGHSGNDLAYVQFTSGTTRAPRGACITHANIMTNLAQLQLALEYRHDDEGLMWLPHYHDLGLVGGILHSLFVGITLTLISPFAFARNPLVWLECISRYRVTLSGGPSFAYKKCVQAYKSAKDLELDLSCWRCANASAELTRPEVLREFGDVFSYYGFSSDAFVHGYGMAEATLGVCSTSLGKLASKVKRFDMNALYQLNANVVADSEPGFELISCGRPVDGMEVKIIDPHSGIECNKGRVGEIWISGPNVTRQFLSDSTALAVDLNAHISGGPDKPYCRTSDMGFMLDGELYMVGRSDQLLLYRQRFLFSPWLEKTISEVHPAFAADGCAVFSDMRSGSEKIVVMQELKFGAHRNFAIDDAIPMVEKALAEQFDIQRLEISFEKPMSLPRTTSGKVQRFVCQLEYLNISRLAS
jgi:acyl-CoA synthetase (AMP-forming)/AMP-acid ligase II